MRTLTLLAGTALAASILLMAGIHLLSAGTANAAKPTAGERIDTITEKPPTVSTSRAWANPPLRSKAAVVDAPAVAADAARLQMANSVNGALPQVADVQQLGTVRELTGSASTAQAASIKKASRRISANGARYTSLSAPIQRPSSVLSEDISPAVAPKEAYQQPIEFSLASR